MERDPRNYLEQLVKFSRPFQLVIVGAVLLVIAGYLTRDAQPDQRVKSIPALIACVGGIAALAGIFKSFRPHGVAQYGIIGLWRPMNSKAFGQRLAAASSLTVIKTWFPEDEHIQDGLERALTNGADVKLILCRPNSRILRTRSKSANVDVSEASSWIFKGLRIVLKRVSPDKFLGVGLHSEWPGCPIIWTHDRIYVGFYFRGKTSPAGPWLEIKKESTFGELLNAQKRKFWRASERLESKDALRQWLQSNEPASLEGGES